MNKQIVVEMNSSAIRAIGNFASCLAAFCTAIVARLPGIAGHPCTDEGFYAFYSMLAHTQICLDGTLPQFGTLQLYPVLTSWVFGLDANPLVLLRFVDMLVAAFVGWQMCRLLIAECKNIFWGASLAILFTIALNQPVFIQFGYKNAGFAAWLCFLVALRLGLGAKNACIYALAGACTAFGVFFRESLCILALVGFLGAWLGRGRKAAFWYAGGGVGAATVFLCAVACWRGLANTLEGYEAFYRFMLSFASSMGSVTCGNFLIALQGAALLGGICTLVAVAAWSGRHVENRGRILFWLAVFCAPGVEILLKGGYPYHFSFMLYGLAGLAAYVLRFFGMFAKWEKAFCIIVMTLSLCWGGKIVWDDHLAIDMGYVLEVASTQEWPENAVERSQYLTMAGIVRKNFIEGDSFAISGLYHIVPVLTKIIPQMNDDSPFGDLSAVTVERQLTEKDMASYLNLYHPTLVLVSERGFDGNALNNAIKNNLSYKLIDCIDSNNERSYGGFAAKLYRRVDMIRND